MRVNAETARARDLFLAFFDFGVAKLLDPPALEAHEVIVMLSLV